MKDWARWKKRLRFRHLQVLLLLHETRNMSRAASMLAMTQPALTKWLRELETDMGVTLFERHSRGLVPSAHCELLVARARLVLNELDRTVEMLEDLSENGLHGRLRLGATPIAMAGTLPTAIATFHRDHPRATVSVFDGYLDLLIPRLKEGQLDLVVSILEDRDYGGGLALQRLYEERFVVIAGSHHPLVGCARVSWKDAVAFPWTGPPATSPIRRELEQELALAHQPMPRFAVEVSSTMLVATLLERTQMLSLVSRQTAGYMRRSGSISVLPLSSQRRSYVGVMWRKNQVLGELEDGLLQALRLASAVKAPLACRAAP